MYNKISNGGNQAGLWRTLTKDEWIYLFQTRTNAIKKYGIACVNEINGIILLPDTWTLPADLTFERGVTVNMGSEYYKTLNEYSAEQWIKMENAGAIFLPVAGYRYGTSINHIGRSSYYWSGMFDNGNNACSVYFDSSKVSPASNFSRNYGLSVRLVQDVE